MRNNPAANTSPTAPARVKTPVDLAAERVAQAKEKAERIAAEVRAQQTKLRELQSEHARIIDGMEAALQAHDAAVRAAQA